MNQSPMGGGGEPAAREVITNHSSPARMLLFKSTVKNLGFIAKLKQMYARQEVATFVVSCEHPSAVEKNAEFQDELYQFLQREMPEDLCDLISVETPEQSLLKLCNTMPVDAEMRSDISDLASSGNYFQCAGQLCSNLRIIALPTFVLEYLSSLRENIKQDLRDFDDSNDSAAETIQGYQEYLEGILRELTDIISTQCKHSSIFGIAADLVSYDAFVLFCQVLNQSDQRGIILQPRYHEYQQRIELEFGGLCQQVVDLTSMPSSELDLCDALFLEQHPLLREQCVEFTHSHKMHSPEYRPDIFSKRTEGIGAERESSSHVVLPSKGV